MTDAPTSDAPSTGTTAGGGSFRRVRRGLLAAVGLVVALAVVVALGGGSTTGDGGSTTGGGVAADSSAPTEDAAPNSGSATPFTPADPTAPPVQADELPAALPAVALTDAVVVEDVRGSLVSVEAIDAEAQGRGNVAGPALRVTVRLENETGAAVSLAEVFVNLRYGAGNTPASPIEDSSQRLFQGTLATGEAAEGTYVFSVPADERESVTIQVGYQAGAPIAVFTGTPG